MARFAHERHNATHGEVDWSKRSLGLPYLPWLSTLVFSFIYIRRRKILPRSFHGIGLDGVRRKGREEPAADQGRDLLLVSVQVVLLNNPSS